MLVRGQEPTHVHMEPYPVRLPPCWDQVGYRSIFAAQTPAARIPYWTGRVLYRGATVMGLNRKCRAAPDMWRSFV